MLPSTIVNPLSTPILFLIFNRPETTQKVFEAIKEARPMRLYIAADGPRIGRLGDAEKCDAVRKIATDIDWECEVYTLFSNENLGCGKGLSSSITWFFEHEEEGIILEDDCLPSPSFFIYCSELLKRYRHDTRVMQIGGTNFEKINQRDQKYSYGFSNLIYIWGWASWRRAWKSFDFQMKHYTEINEKRYLEGFYNSIYERDFYKYIFKKMHKGDERTNSTTIWDYQWLFACKINSGLIIIPNSNLVVNLGLGKDATNTHDPRAVGYDLALEEMKLPLTHPTFMMVNSVRDNRIFLQVCTSLSSRIKSRIKNLLPRRMLEKYLQ